MMNGALTVDTRRLGSLLISGSGTQAILVAGQMEHSGALGAARE
jgi:hypothetical protein